MAYGNVKRK